MALRTGHGRGAGVPRVEVLPVDELPAGVPGPARPVATRDDAGRFVPSAGTTALAREGGKAAGESRQLAALLGLWTPPEGHPYAPYARIARDFRDQHMAELAASVGGGQVGSGPASIVSTAAMQVAASRWLYDEAGRTGAAKLFGESSRLGDASRQNLLAAHELAAREAAARPRNPALDPIEQMRRAAEAARAARADGGVVLPMPERRS